MAFIPRPGNLMPQPGLTPVAAANFTALTSTAGKGKLLEAVKFAHGLWQTQARFQNIIINGPTAQGPPGCLAGPALEPLIRSAPGVAADQGAAADLRNAVARGVSECFAAWQSGVMVPGLPWYPPFAAFPGPVAPPMPNVPAPLVVCPSSQVTRLSQASLQQAMVNALPAALRVPQVQTAVTGLSRSLATYFTTWLPMQQVMGVMGTGPVPTYAPPMVPVGPVVAGSVISAPGHLAVGALPTMIVM